MKRIWLLPFIALLSQPVVSQTAVDTIFSLQNVDVQGKRFARLGSGEIKRLQVESNLSSVTGTTADAFRQLPSVITDIEGGVTFRGSNKPALLINGIPYGMMEEYSGDVLIQLPALFFNRIAATSFPLIEFVPDGDAGVLNLSSARFTRNDSPLQVTLGAGLEERYNAGAIVNLHPGKFHIVGKYNYRREYRERSFRKTTIDKTGTALMDNNATARPDVHLADLNVGYDLTSHDVLSVYGLYYLMDYSRYGGINNTKQNPAGEVMNRMLRHRYNDQRQQAYAAEASWTHQFMHPEDQLRIVFNYNNFAYDEDNDYKNEKPGTGNILAEDNLFIRQKKDNYYASASYRKGFADGWSLKAGYIGRIKSETYSADASDKKEGSWVPNSKKTYVYSFDRYTNLLYASVEKKWNDFYAEVGAQGELTCQKVDDLSDHSRFHLYPRASLSYQASESGKWMFNYLQRAIRPYGADLNPYLDSSDATHLREGNPDLKDEFIHSLELSYQFTASRFRFSPSVYYRNRKDRIMEVALQQNEQTIWKKENIGHSQTLGLELAGYWSPIRILSASLSGDIYRDEMDGRIAGYSEKKSLICWDIKGDVHVHITPTTEFQVDGFYVSDQLTPQGKIKGHYSVNAGLSQYLLHRKLRANLSMNNLFNSLAETMTIDTEGLQITQVRNRDARVTWLTLTYSL